MFQELQKQNMIPQSTHPATLEEIQNFEQELGVTLGKEYKTFLQEYGYLSVGSLEFYGICGDNKAIPSALHATMTMRKYIDDFPKNFIVFFEYGDGSYCCIDSRDNVYICEHDHYEKTKESFKKFVNKNIKIILQEEH